MPSQQTDHLFTLIKSLSKSEKRHFKLFVNRNQSNQDTKFLLLFDILDRSSAYNESSILEKIPVIKKQQLSNLKAHLYKQLLVSLRLLHNNKLVDIQIRENIDYARILYKKGLYLQSLKVLGKAKTAAQTNYLDILLLEILEFEKLIESRHITRSLEGRAEELALQTKIVLRNIDYTSQLSSLSLNLYGIYLKLGHTRHPKDKIAIDKFFAENLPDIRVEDMTFYEKLYWCQSHSWYYIIKQDWIGYYKYSRKWVDLFEDEEGIRQRHPVTYMKGLHNVLNALFLIGNYQKYKIALQNLEDYYRKNATGISMNTETRAFLYIYMAKLNLHFIEGSFTDGLVIIPEIEGGLERFKMNMDVHRVLVFYYKIACLYFGSGDNSNAIVYLNKIIQLRIGNLRTDIQCFARMLHLIAHYELKHYDLLEYLIKSVYRFLLKHEDLSQVLSEVLRFLRKALYLRPSDLIPAFRELKSRLEELVLDPFERRSFLYLDLISWLESKIEGVPVEHIIHKKFLAKTVSEDIE